MSREWKPGDVARVKGDGMDTVAFRTLEGGWVWVDQKGTNPIHGASFCHGSLRAPRTEARPLVVIDPEDSAQVERLAELAWGGHISWENLGDNLRSERIAWIQAALRSLVAPPKPEEPTGLGAVVEDEHGNRWTRIYDGSGEGPAWYCDMPLPTSRISGEQWLHYADIAVVRVLSEGVQP